MPESDAQRGLYPRFLNADGTIVTWAWNRAAELGEHLGTCRDCGGYLKADPTTQSGRINWYSGYCTNCNKQLAAPNGEYLRRSSRWGQMPQGFWDAREKRLNGTARSR